MSDLHVTRPSTAFLKIIDKFASFSGIGNIAPTLISSGINRTSIKNDIKIKKVSNVLASQLQNKIAKMIKVKNKLILLQSEFSNDLTSWSCTIPNLESEIMIKEFATLFTAQKFSDTSIVEKLEKLKLNLSFINEREKKQKNLIFAKHKLIKQLRDSQAKYGPNASSTTLLTERLEENVCNLEVVENQYIRAITNNLKESLIDYLIDLLSNVKKLDEAGSEYFQCLANLESDSEFHKKKDPYKSTVCESNDKDAFSPLSSIFNGVDRSEFDNGKRPKVISPNKDFTNHDINFGKKQFRKLHSNETENHLHCSDCKKSVIYNRFSSPCSHSKTNNYNLENLNDNILSQQNYESDVMPLKSENEDFKLQSLQMKEDILDQHEHWA